MEHRWRKRLKKAIKVMLYHNCMPVVSCKTRDIGTNGIFVESGLLTYRINTLLEIEFEGSSRFGRQWYRLRVVVVHFSSDGLGLFIVDSESKSLGAWQHVVHGDGGYTSDDETGMSLDTI